LGSFIGGNKRKKIWNQRKGVAGMAEIGAFPMRLIEWEGTYAIWCDPPPERRNKNSWDTLKNQGDSIRMEGRFEVGGCVQQKQSL
jgi:hypothetical protein